MVTFSVSGVHVTKGTFVTQMQAPINRIKKLVDTLLIVGRYTCQVHGYRYSTGVIDVYIP